jgi:hemerythrin
MASMSATSQQMAAAAQEVSASMQVQTGSVDQVTATAQAVAVMAGDLGEITVGYQTAAAVWSDAFVADIAFVDEQHRTLFDAINRFGDAVARGRGAQEVGQTLQFLLHYTGEHFAEEEALMQRHDFPQLAAHKAMHDTFVRKVQDLIVQHQQGNRRAMFLASRMMTEWLQRHILDVDLKGFVPYVKGREQHGSASGGRLPPD